MSELVTHFGDAEITPDGEFVGARPQWLLNEFYDDTWFLQKQQKGNSNSYYTVNWHSGRLAKGTSAEKYWIEYAKKVAFCAMESDLTDVSSTSTLALYSREVNSVCLWFCHERKCFRVSEITSADVVAFEQYVASLQITVSSVQIKLRALRLFWILKEDVGEGLSFEPYLKAGQVSKAAKRIGLKNSHTKTIKPMDLFGLLNSALGHIAGADIWVERLGVYHELKERYSASHFARKFKRVTGVSTDEMCAQIKIIYGASLAICFLLLGERKHELAETLYDDVLAMIDDDEDELPGVVRKTARTRSGKQTRRPVIRELKNALQTVISITENPRKSYSGGMLFIHDSLRHSAGKNKQTELGTRVIYELLDSFSNDMGFDGTLRPHMFRRAYSLLWMWRFEIGDLKTLSAMLFHNSEEFTKAYVEGEGVWEYLPDAQREFTHDLMTKLLLGERSFQGGGGKSIGRYMRLLMSKISVVTPEAIDALVKRLIEKHNYRIVPQIDGYCMISDKRGMAAKCSEDGKFPDYVNRDDLDCVSCANFGVDVSRRSCWEARNSAHKRVLNTATIPLLQDASKEAVHRSEVVLNWIGVEEG